MAATTFTEYLRAGQCIRHAACVSELPSLDGFLFYKIGPVIVAGPEVIIRIH